MLKESNYGRNFGWYIFYEEKKIGELIDCKFEEMFWDSYKVIHYGEEELNILKTNKYWEEVKFQFKNKVINEFAENAFGSHLNYTENKSERILMRGLYFPEEETFLTKLKNKLL